MNLAKPYWEKYYCRQLAHMNRKVKPPSPSDRQESRVDQFLSCLSKLSRRERTVFRLLLEAESTRSISECLGISERTVESHREKILQKFGVRNSLELAAMVVKAYAHSRIAQSPDWRAFLEGQV